MIHLLLILGLTVNSSVDGGVDTGSPDGSAGPGETPHISDSTGGSGGSAEVAGARRVGRLRGRVLAKGSQDPVFMATITAKTAGGTELRAETDEGGSFDLQLPCGEMEIRVAASRYEPQAVAWDACLNTSPLLVRLAPRTDLPVYETVVVARRDEPSVDLHGPELTTTPGSLGDPFRVIESLPGVAVVAWPAPVYAVRGANPGNTGYFLDGLPVPLLFHLALGPSVIHPYFFDRIDFFPGGYPAQYGRYVAGIVAAQTRAADEERAHAVADVRLYDAGALVSAPWPDGKGGMAAAFRYSYTGALFSLVENDIRLSYWDYQIRADRRVGDWHLSLLAFGSSDDLEYRTSGVVSSWGQPATLTEVQDSYRLQFHRASLRASRQVGDGQLRARLAFGVDDSSVPMSPSYEVASRAYSIFPRLSYERPGRNVDWDFGLDGQAEWLRPASSAYTAGASDLARNRTALLGSGYVGATIHGGGRLSLTPGLRVDSYTISGITDADLAPRLSARFLLSPTTWLSASGGRFSQAPSLNVQVPAAENFGLGLYGLQSSWQGSVGVGTDRLRLVDIEVTGFLQRYVLTDLRDPTLTSPDPLASDFLVRRDARAYGMELMIRRPAVERLSGWISYTLSNNERALGPGVVGPSDWDQRHIFNAVLGYRIGAYSLGLRGHLHTGRPVLVEGGQAEAFVRLPTFYQLDLRVERHILFDAYQLDVYAEVVNATATREVFGLSQDPNTGAISQQAMRLVIPSVGVRGTFSARP